MKAIRRHLLLIGAAGLCLISSAIGQSSQAEIAIPESIPIFPLQDIMLFPGASRSLHIFEPRYRDMIADAMEGARIIGMVMLKPNNENNYDGNPHPSTILAARDYSRISNDFQMGATT